MKNGKPSKTASSINRLMLEAAMACLEKDGSDIRDEMHIRRFIAKNTVAALAAATEAARREEDRILRATGRRVFWPSPHHIVATAFCIWMDGDDIEDELNNNPKTVLTEGGAMLLGFAQGMLAAKSMGEAERQFSESHGDIFCDAGEGAETLRSL